MCHDSYSTKKWVPFLSAYLSVCPSCVWIFNDRIFETTEPTFFRKKHLQVIITFNSQHDLYVFVVQWVYQRERRPVVLRLWVRYRTGPVPFFSCIGITLCLLCFVLWLELSMLMTSSQIFFIGEIKNGSPHFLRKCEEYARLYTGCLFYVIQPR